MKQSQVIAVTMGDPSGVGPEICLHLLQDSDLAKIATPVIFGSAAILQRVSASTGIPFDAPVVTHHTSADFRDSITAPRVLDLPFDDQDEIVPGKIDPRCGAAAFSFVDRAIDLALGGQVDAVTTAPLNKEALRKSGIHFPGHTEIFASRMGAERSCMMQYSEEVTCTFVTVHVGYAEVPSLLTRERILEVIELTHEGLIRILSRPPKIVVLGLNPHAGEHGLFGNHEEEKEIIPAVKAAQAKGISVEGPIPPDTAFLPSKRKATDAFVCMYHDQGHIPLKALAFDTAVNTTLGLPIPRTSVDHGTAFDIAWQGVANPQSLKEAFALASNLSRRKNPDAQP